MEITKDNQKMMEFVKRMRDAGLEKYLDNIVWMSDGMPILMTEKPMFLTEFRGLKVCHIVGTGDN